MAGKQMNPFTTCRPKRVGCLLLRASPLWCSCLALLFSAAATAGASVRIDEFADGAQNIVLPIYAPNRTEAVAVLRARRVFEDHERRGFFRIGVLPLVAVEEIALEVRDANRFGAALEKAAAHLALSPQSKRLLDGRGFSLLFPGSTNACLKAAKLRVRETGTWQLENVIVAIPGRPMLALRHASLHVTGAAAGELVGESSAGRISLRLTAPEKPPPP